jgi:squalene-hopene cyclase-like protein
MNAEEKDLLHRHLNGDLDASEQAAFFSRLQSSTELRRELASHAMDEMLLSELVLEGRTAAKAPARRRSWAPIAVAAALLVALTLLLTMGRNASSKMLRVTSFDGAVVLHRGGVEEPIYAGRDLRWGDRIVTALGRVVLERDDLRVDIGPNSAFELRRAKGLEAFVAEKGRVAARISSERDQSVWFPQGTFDTKDATLRMEVTSRRTQIDVDAGSIELSARPGDPIRAGHTISIGSDREIGRPVGRSRVDDAVRRGFAFLESRRSDLVTPITSEKRHGAAPRRTYAELALLALHRAGVPDSDPLKSELLGVVKGRTIESTYAAVLQAMALAEIDPFSHQERIRLCAQVLTDSQCANGQWDYAVKPALPGIPAGGRIRRRQEGPASGDNSVTSYAILGLRACAQAGVEVDPDVLARARAWWLQCQNADGGWGYNDSGDRTLNDGSKRTYTTNASYGSATASAVASLAAIRELGDDGRSDAAIRRGVEWLGANFSADRNPRKDPGFVHLHWLISAARAGTILGTEKFGPHEWYAEGADFLLQAQRPTGEWAVEQGEFMKQERNDVLDTCLAILFLRRTP